MEASPISSVVARGASERRAACGEWTAVRLNPSGQHSDAPRAALWVREDYFLVRGKRLFISCYL
jgi:hypothetical protein